MFGLYLDVKLFTSESHALGTIHTSDTFVRFSLVPLSIYTSAAEFFASIERSSIVGLSGRFLKSDLKAMIPLSRNPTDSLISSHSFSRYSNSHTYRLQIDVILMSFFFKFPKIRNVSWSYSYSFYFSRN